VLARELDAKIAMIDLGTVTPQSQEPSSTPDTLRSGRLCFAANLP